MNVSIYIARRYLFSKKSLNAINLISGISMLGVFVGTAALVIILSVFNGFEGLVLSLYNSITPELVIEPAQGKTFDPRIQYLAQLRKDPRVIAYVEVLQEKALLEYDGIQYIATIKGVSNDFLKGREPDSLLSEGTLTLQTESNNYAVIGSLVQSSLGIELNQELNYLQIYSPRKSGSTNPSEQFTIKTIAPSGVLKMQKQLDPIVLLPIGFARELMEEEENVSALELSVQTSSVYAIQEQLSANLGPKFIVKNRAQQNQLLYKILNSEKSAVFLILTFVLIIAIFNIIGSLTMLVMDKRKDVAILKSMGANDTLVRRIFFSQGMMISMAGCVSGMLTGLLFCLLQQQYGFIKMEDVTLIADNSYPIILKWQDFVLIFFTVSLISVAASSIASRLSIKNAVDLKENL